MQLDDKSLVGTKKNNKQQSKSKGMKIGRKPLYTEWLNEKGLAQVKEWAEEGLINKQIAYRMGINVGTLYEWQVRFPEFADAIKRGKKVIDEQVENSLLKRALGYQYEEETWEKNQVGQLVLIKRVVKSQTPDVSAQIFWLKNRQPERWRERVEIKNEHEGTIRVEMGALEKWSN